MDQPVDPHPAARAYDIHARILAAYDLGVDDGSLADQIIADCDTGLAVGRQQEWAKAAVKATLDAFGRGLVDLAMSSSVATPIILDQSPVAGLPMAPGHRDMKVIARPIVEAIWARITSPPAPAR